jgi:CBS domain-containing protein
MIVESLMTRDPVVCRPESTLADAAAIMWRCDCGVVPVTDGDERVVGVITDRDICMALALSGQNASEARVGDVMARDVQVCTPVDDVREALEAMRKRQVRRLPVVNSMGKLVGVLSINDIILHTRKGKNKKRVSRRVTLATLRAICRPHGSTESDEVTDTGDGETSEGESAAPPVEEHFNETAVVPPPNEKPRQRVGKSKTAGRRKTASKRKSVGEAKSESVVDAKSESVVDAKSESVGEGDIAE